MIIVKINGGLGNQLFQYAAGRALAEHHQTELALDLSWFKNIPGSNTHREFQLKIYPIVARIVSAEEHARLTFYHGRILRRIPFLPRPWNHVCEKGFKFDPKFFLHPDNSYLDGYWQSSYYFERIEKSIQEELQPLQAPGQENQNLLDQVQRVNSVAIHIRRGDYVSNAAANQHHGVCDLYYYQQAISFIQNSVSNPHFYVFSDDLVWAKENLPINNQAVFVGNNAGNQAFQDLRLIAACKHQIIANSSFSWWGAWLNQNLSKIVIAPKRWFAVSKDTSTLFPKNWITL